MLLQTLGDDDHWISLFAPSPASFLIALQLACHEHALSLLSQLIYELIVKCFGVLLRAHTAMDQCLFFNVCRGLYCDLCVDAIIYALKPALGSRRSLLDLWVHPKKRYCKSLVARA